MGRFFSIRLRQFTENSVDFLTSAVYNKLKTENYCETCNYFSTTKRRLTCTASSYSSGQFRWNDQKTYHRPRVRRQAPLP